MTSNPYDFERIPTVTPEMILFARDIIWRGISSGPSSPGTDRIREVALWLGERAETYQALEEQEAVEKAFIAAVEEETGQGWTYPGAIRKVLSTYKLEKL
ncbi:hypothetical protein [Mycobacteroides abscessus]|uniref:hypothetical protein n=1 Tax=Mycobacteroides abscessus TaxID=36809 RepID=UPI00092B37CA|nr:hypothetical protein [Mycobacteroides abscessus]SHT13688.1 Uncharacterised protein [Mycobacteroides abscessus subsp. abscessus]SIC59381.1 Uncharacterised protein [Mycobacteroides abscessus subsp. abscessus]SKO60086.1 Uncharacterised protein [Mycobacteroides abscessus subsp. abscessus]